MNTELERGELYGWIDDLPAGTKQEFLDCLRYFRSDSEVNILEIGCYTGCSLIEIFKYIPHAYATVIDPWMDYEEEEKMRLITKNGIENMFYRNIKNSGIDKRISVHKGRSSDVLPILIQEKKKFNLIYIDGSHKCLDTFLDCVLSWKLLNKDGILVVDDYTWELNYPILERPYEGVNHFLNLYKNEYKLLSNNYRVFLLKI
jgi:predicted O-methyltransferase YrrM